MTRLSTSDRSALERWLAALAAMRDDDWVAAGRACTDRRARAARDGAHGRVYSMLIAERLDLVAWTIVDDVETLVAVACPACLSRRAADRRALDAARKAAGWAALAMILGRRISDADRCALAAPFDLPLREVTTALRIL